MFKFEDVFRVTNRALLINGSHPGLSRDIRWALKSFVTLFISTTLSYFISNSIITYRIPDGDFTEAVREAVIAILAFTVICKYSIVVFNKKVVSNLISCINDDYENSVHFSAEEITIVDKYVKKGTNAIKMWLLSVIITGSAFAAKGLLPTVYYHCIGQKKYVQIFDLIYPSVIENNKNEFFGYCSVCLTLCLFIVYACFVYIGYEPLISIFLLHACGQLEILSLRMKNIFKHSKTRHEIFDEIRSINSTLQCMYKFVEDVQKTFVPLFEFTMKTTTIALPLTVFQIVQSLKRHEVNFEFLLLFFCAQLQFYLPCYYSNLLMEKSEHMRLAFYSCGWENEPNTQIRKMLLFMLTRTSRPVVLNTFFYPLCLDTFAEMCRQSYAIYNIMVAVWT